MYNKQFWGKKVIWGRYDFDNFSVRKHSKGVKIVPSPLTLTIGDKIAKYAYNGNGLRMSKTVNGVITKHVWDGSNIVAELNGENVATAKYTRGAGLISCWGRAFYVTFFLTSR